MSWIDTIRPYDPQLDSITASLILFFEVRTLDLRSVYTANSLMGNLVSGVKSKSVRQTYDYMKHLLKQIM